MAEIVAVSGVCMRIIAEHRVTKQHQLKGEGSRLHLCHVAQYYAWPQDYALVLDTHAAVLES